MALAAAVDLISHEAVTAMEAQLDNGASIEALRRFDRNLRALTIDNWGAQRLMQPSAGMLPEGAALWKTDWRIVFVQRRSCGRC